MATHCSIEILAKKDSKVFLNTTHDGHFGNTLKTILGLPKLIASHSYLPKILTKSNKDKALSNSDLLRDLVNQHAGAGFEWTTLELAAAIVSSHFNRWLIIPGTRIKALASYDQKPSFTVNFSDIDAVRIVFNDRVDTAELETVNALISYLDTSYSFLQSAVRVDESGINNIPFYKMYIQNLAELI